MRIPKHIGVIPDGNRRWAVSNGLNKEMGYTSGLIPAVKLFNCCRAVGINEITYYGFTIDNTKRPSVQTQAFVKACVKAVELLSTEDASLLVVGNSKSKMFPKELLPYAEKRVNFGNGGIRVNFLVNYGWEWDLMNLNEAKMSSRNSIYSNIRSYDVSRVDLLIRWGGRRRLSGFLPIQSVYTDFYVIDDLWPDFSEDQFYKALEWYDTQDVTLGG